MLTSRLTLMPKNTKWFIYAILSCRLRKKVSSSSFDSQKEPRKDLKRAWQDAQRVLKKLNLFREMR